ncbi:MAG: hypothetical protein WCW27_01495 [Patescibacteria group bacterium]|jgi:hypothetical protein
MSIIKDFPKIESPFVRKLVNDHYIVTPEINPEYAWVFQEVGVRAVDKIDGTNVCLRISGGQVTNVFNRQNEKFVFPPAITQTAWEGACLEGIARAIQKDWLHNLIDGDYFGELIGELINGNPQQLTGHLWVPFNYLARKCHWRSWIKNQYPKDYESISQWFKDLPSLFNQTQKLPPVMAEGLVFYHPDGKRLAKLRRDMFDWFEGERHHFSAY